MLYLFDLDGTLISGYMDNPDKDYDTWAVLPGRVATLAALRAAKHRIGIVTNQGAVAFGFVTEEQFKAKLLQALEALGLPTQTPVLVCFSDPRSKDPRYNQPESCARRKPSGAMIRELVAFNEEYVAACGALYVGDRPEDEAAAADAGVRFQWAEEFFGSADVARAII